MKEPLMLLENMPYYRGPKIQPPAEAATVEETHVQYLMTSIATATSDSPDPLCTMPIIFGLFPELQSLTEHLVGPCTTRNLPPMHSKRISFHGLYITSPMVTSVLQLNH